MLDVVFADLQARAHEWEARATERRTISTTDPVADALIYCADQLRDTVRGLEQESGILTPDQYGALCLPPVTGQTVTRWIRRAELDATWTATGWAIRRTAQRHRQKVPA